MTGLVRKATLFGVCAVMVASAAMANVPDPTNSTCPAFITVVGTLGGVPDNAGGRGTITVRDFANNPISGAVTSISFRNACDINLCNLISASDVAEFSTVIDCDSSIVRGNTNAAGQFSFTIVGSAKGATDASAPGTGRLGSLIIVSNTIKLCSATGVSLDQDGSGVGGSQGVVGGDVGNLLSTVGEVGLGEPYTARGDINKNGVGPNGADVGSLLTEVGRYGLGGGGGCPGGLANLCKTNKCPSPF